MLSVIFVDSSGERHVVNLEPGQSLMRAARTAGVPGITGECGGCLTCGTCQVYVDKERAALLPGPKTDERDMLDVLLNAKPNSRLSCQLRASPLFADLVLEVP